MIWPAGIEERHIQQRGNGDDPADGLNVQTNRVGRIQGDNDNVAPGSNGLCEELPGTRGSEFSNMRF